jgi:hypothetical protein
MLMARRHCGAKPGRFLIMPMRQAMMGLSYKTSEVSKTSDV